MDNYKDFKNFKFFGVYVDAYKNKDDEYSKRSIMPNTLKLGKDYINFTTNNLNNVWDKNRQMMVSPNGIAIMTEKSNITVIDVDEPENCIILDDLLNDCKFIVKTRKGYHLYFNRCNDIPIQSLLNIIDVNTNLIYYIPKYYEYNVNNIIKDTYIDKNGKVCYFDKFVEYKINKKVEFNYTLIKNEGELSNLPDYAIMYIKTLISLKNKTQTITNPTIKNVKPDYIIQPDIEINKFSIETMDIIYKILFDNNYFNDGLKQWLKVAYMCKHCNNSQESFNLFHKYSTQIEKYSNNTDVNNAYYFFGKNEYNLNFDETALLYLVKRLNGKIFKEKLQKLLLNNKYDNLIEKFERKYIYPNKTDEDYNIHIIKFNEFIEKDEFKFMLLKSAYGTGKTYYFKSLLNLEVKTEQKKEKIISYIEEPKYNVEPKYIKVVFITYRQSLAHSLINELSEKYGFQHYQDIKGDIKCDRVVCQLDSILRILDNNYDLIVLDEIEGLLNHMSSPLMKNQFMIYNKLKKMILESNKILCMDGDLGERSYEFINDMNFKVNYKNRKIQNGIMVKKDLNINDTYFKIYQNTFKTQTKHYKFMSGDALFYESINKDMKDCKKICIVSMSAGVCEMIETIYGSKYKVIKHTGIEKNTLILKEFKNEWKKCDILCYSPTIEAGLDFDDEYFDKCYGIICKESTTPRAFCQMSARIRNYREHEINVLMLGINTFIDNGLIYRKEEIETFKFEDYSTEDETFINILIQNETEKINARTYLITEFTTLLKSKGHTYEYISDTTKTKREKDEKPKNIKINKILNSNELSEEDFKELENMRKCNIELTSEDFYSIQKYLYTQYFNVSYEDINYDWLYDRLDKFSVVGNVRRLISYCNKNNEINNLYNNCLLFETLLLDDEKNINIINKDINKFNVNLEIESKKKQKYIIDMIQLLGYNIVNGKLEQTNQNIEEVNITEFEKLYNSKKFNILFDNSRKFKTINTMKCINDLLNKYGMRFDKKRVHSHYEEKEGEEKKQIYKYIIKGNYIPIIEELFKSDIKKKEQPQRIIIDMDEEPTETEEPKKEEQKKEEYKFTNEEIKRIEEDIKKQLEQQQKDIKIDREMKKLMLNKKIQNAKKKGKTEIKLTKLEKELLNEMKEEHKK